MTTPTGDDGAAPTWVAADPDLVPPPPTPVGRDSTAGVAVMAHLRRQTGALLAADAGLDDDAPDAVHAARVAARRLRSGLRVYGDLLRDDVAARLRPELAWYAGALSPVRDLEVFAASLAAAPDEDLHGYGDALLPWVRHRLALARAAALDDARSPRAADAAPGPRVRSPARRRSPRRPSRKAPRRSSVRASSAPTTARRACSSSSTPGRRVRRLALGPHRRQARALRRRGRRPGAGPTRARTSPGCGPRSPSRSATRRTP